MQKKSLIVWMFIAVAMLSGAANAAAGKKQNQQEQLEEIEKYISQQRQKIEDSYIGRSTDLRLRAEGQIRLLEVVKQAIYAPLDAQAEVAETVLQINNYEVLQVNDREVLLINGHENAPYDHFEGTTDTSPQRFAVVLSQISEVKNDILAKYEFGAISLEKQKRYALTVGLPELEGKLKENVLAAKPKPTHGVITGIVYAEEDPSAIIDGQIVHEGDRIHNVTVVKIHRDKIEFEKKNKKWKQTVQETPGAFW
jgi:hypothetical protein